MSKYTPIQAYYYETLAGDYILRVKTKKPLIWQLVDPEGKEVCAGGFSYCASYLEGLLEEWKK